MTRPSSSWALRGIAVGLAEFAYEHHDNHNRTQDRHGKGEYECPRRFSEVKSLGKRPGNSAGDSGQVDQDERNFQRSKLIHLEASTFSSSERTLTQLRTPRVDAVPKGIRMRYSGR